MTIKHTRSNVALNESIILSQAASKRKWWNLFSLDGDDFSARSVNDWTRTSPVTLRSHRTRGSPHCLADLSLRSQKQSVY